jgi:hypothetical protein
MRRGGATALTVFASQIPLDATREGSGGGLASVMELIFNEVPGLLWLPRVDACCEETQVATIQDGDPQRK